MSMYLYAGGLVAQLPVIPGGTVPTVGREALVVGVDKPGPTNTGPYSVTSFTDVYPTGTNTDIMVSTTTPQIGKRYWGTVKAVAGARFEQCVFAGPDPLLYGMKPWGADRATPLQKGCIQNFGTTPPKWGVFDSRLDNGEWLKPYAPGGPRGFLSPSGCGYHGCNVELRRCEVVNCGDGVDIVGPNGQDMAAVYAQETVIEQNWIHKGTYHNDVRYVDDGQNHADGVQTATGRKIRIRGNTIGGSRDPVGYNTWPGGYVGGDDFCYSAIQLTQEIDITDANRLEDIMIELNWLGGGTATISHPYDRGNSFASTTIRNNRFMRRLTDWGKTMAAKASTSWEPYQRNTGVGSYISMQTGVASTRYGNVFEDNGQPVPGANQ